MPDVATMEAMRDTYWPLALLAIGAGTFSALITERRSLLRCILALVIGNAAQFGWEAAMPPGGYLLWWQHMVIDLGIFVVVTTPPRHYWQSTMGALLFAQIVLHGVWGLVPELAAEHWLGCTLIGFAQFALLLLWSGGARVERVLSRIARSADRMVLASSGRKLA